MRSRWVRQRQAPSTKTVMVRVAGRDWSLMVAGDAPAAIGLCSQTDRRPGSAWSVAQPGGPAVAPLSRPAKNNARQREAMEAMRNFRSWSHRQRPGQYGAVAVWGNGNRHRPGRWRRPPSVDQTSEKQRPAARGDGINAEIPQLEPPAAKRGCTWCGASNTENSGNDTQTGRRSPRPGQASPRQPAPLDISPPIAHN